MKFLFDLSKENGSNEMDMNMNSAEISSITSRNDGQLDNEFDNIVENFVNGFCSIGSKNSSKAVKSRVTVQKDKPSIQITSLQSLSTCRRDKKRKKYFTFDFSNEDNYDEIV